MADFQSGRFSRNEHSGFESELFCVQDRVPPIESHLRHNILRMPSQIQRASGFVVYGKRIRSLVFSTDIAIIRNCDADAVFCVYPFTAQRAVSAAVIHAASMPVFVGVGGGTTQGTRAVYLAMDAENQGAMGVVFNAPIPDPDLHAAARILDIPIVITVTTAETDFASRIKHGASIVNVAGGKMTPQIVEKVRSMHPQIPIIASGGRTSESIVRTIDAGANAIVYTPPSSGELFRGRMAEYRA